MGSPASSVVRPSAIAGTWYPARAEPLRHTVEGYLDRVQAVDLPGQVLALVVPHAGYAYSGLTAAHSFAQVRGSAYHRVVLVGPLHRPIWGRRLGSFMVPEEDAYATPLGQVPVDRAFVTELSERVPVTPVRHDEEHSLEIQLPFLQVALEQSFLLVPIMLGEHVADPGAEERLQALSAALAELVGEGRNARGEKTLLVASTDLSHLDNYDEVVRTDGHLAELVAAFDVPRLAAALAEGEIQACGAAGLVTALDTARRLGAHGVRVLSYAASGDVTGDRRPGTYTVGYLAAAAFG